MFERDNLKII